MKYYLIFFLFIAYINNLSSQTVLLNQVKWTFGTSPGTLLPTIPISLQSRISASEISKSFGLLPDLSFTENGSGNPGNALIVKGFDEFTNSPEDPFDVYIQYIQFSITPNVNNFMTINGITMDIRHQGMSNQLPNMATARFKVGSAPWNTITTNNTINSAWNPITFPTIGFINKVNTIVQFQIGFWYSGVQVKDPNGQVRIDNITFSTGSTLPIELTTFTATLVPTGIALKWSTASEINNAYVAVERSTDGSRYDEIGRVPGQGDSFDPRDYNYTDESPEKGVNYYRLRQVDYDGAENFSPVVQATFGKTGKLSVYPSPATERLNVTLTETEGDPVRWEVYDVSGRLTLSGTQESDTVSFPIELGNLPEGVYTVQVFVGREVMTERFVKK